MQQTGERTQKSKSAAVFTPLEDDVLLLERFTGTEELGQLFEYDLDLLSERPDEVDPDKLLGSPMSVRLNLADGSVRWFTGFVSEFTQVAGKDELAAFHATLVPWNWMLTRSADCRIFHDSSCSKFNVPAIVKEIFREFGASAFKESLSEEYQFLEYCVQYSETAFDFVNRLLEREGIYYFFTHAQKGHVLVLADDPSAHQAYEGYGELTYRPQQNVYDQSEHIYKWERTREVQPGAVAMRSFNFKKPGDDLTVRKSASREHENSKLEVYEFPGTYTELNVGEKYALVRLDEFQSEFDVIDGKCNTRGIACGHTFTVSGLPDGDPNEEFLVTYAKYTIVPEPHEMDGEAPEEEPIFVCKFTAIPAKQRYRPPRVTPRPMIRGPQTAIVVGPAGEEIHTDKYGRVRVQFPWDRRGKKDDQSSCFIRVAQIWAGGKWGSIHIPRIGQEVMVEYLEGDPDRPIITGRVYNNDQMPPYDLPANMTQSGIKSRSTKHGGPNDFNEIRMEDKRGSEQLYIHAEKNQDIVVENDETHFVGHDRKKQIKHDEAVSVDHDRTESVGNNENISIGNDRTENVDGNEKISIGKSRNTDVGKNEDVSIAENRTESVGKDETITISGGRTENVSKAEAITIGKSRTVQVGENDNLDVGKKINIVAGDEITIKTGDASIVLKKNGDILISGKNIKINGSGKIDIAASAKMTLKGSQIAEN